jgi:hypothetical protein
MKLFCRYRILLPAGHTAIDLLLLVAWIWHAVVVLNPPKAWSRPPGNALAAYAEEESIGWTPATTWTEHQPRFELIRTGTLPAGIVSTSVRPEAGWQTRHRLWDPWWILVHEAVAIPFWFLIGAWLDTGRSRLGQTMQAYLAGRVALALLAMAGSGIGWKAQVLFWLGLAAYGGLWAWRWLLRTARMGLAASAQR